MDILYYIGNLLISYAVLGFLMLKIMNGFYTPRYTRKWVYVLALILYMILGISIYQLGFALLKSIYTVSVFFILSFSLFQTSSVKKMLGYNLLALIFLIAVDALGVLLLSTFSNIDIKNVLLDVRIAFIISNCTVILYLCSYRLFLGFFKGRSLDRIELQQNILLFCLAIFEVMLLTYIMTYSDASAIQWMPVLISMVILCIDAYLIYLFESISKKNHLEQEMMMTKQQITMQDAYFKTIEAQYDASQRLIHDMRNHLHTLKNLYTDENSSVEQEIYAKMIYEKMDQIGNYFKCDNRVLNIIMSDKIRHCEDEGISIKTEMQNLEIQFINPFDLTTIFSNVLDNAIEACEEAAGDQRLINIRMYRFNDFLIINVSNTAIKPPVYEKNNLITTKKKGHFGLGLSNVRMALDNYGGNLSIDYKPHLFTTKIVIPFPN